MLRQILSAVSEYKPAMGHVSWWRSGAEDSRSARTCRHRTTREYTASEIVAVEAAARPYMHCLLRTP